MERERGTTDRPRRDARRNGHGGTFSSDASSRIRTELDLRAHVTNVEAEMAGIGNRVKVIDDVLNQQLALRQPRGTRAAIDQYLAWLDRVEALGLAYVNANIVTQRLRLFYQGTARTRGDLPDPAPRMREVKNLLETVRHSEQANLLLLRAQRHALLTEIQNLARERKSTRRDTPRRSGKPLGAVTLLVVALAALLLGSVLLESFRPEIVRFVRSAAGLPSASQAPP